MSKTEKKKEETFLVLLDPAQVQATVDLLKFHAQHPLPGNAKKRRTWERDLVRRASRVLRAEPDAPLMLRVMGRTERYTP